ncbi:hypothetical protein JTB14_011038 [Gonioctena quinquepunctata]|nr:hypothetical protein JTB14_011038 [Gonioctena quinquepunctata]
MDTFWGCFCEETCVQKCCANNNMIINNVCMESNTGSIEISDSNHSETHLSPDDLRCEYTDNISEEDLWEGISDGSVFVKKRGKILEFSELCLEKSPNDHIFMCIFGKKSDRNTLSENNTAIIIGDGTKSDEVDICSRKICVRKCCALGEILWKNHTCFEKNYPLHTLESSLLETNFNKDIHHLFSSMLICGANFVRVSTPVFQLEINGSINSEGLSISTDGYCLDTFLNKNGKYDFMALICEMEDAEIEIVYNSSGKYTIYNM